MILCIIFGSNKINCLFDLRESKALGSWSFSPDGTKAHPESQCGFCAGGGTADMLFAARQF